MVGAHPTGGSILCERGGIAYAPARDAGERKLMRVRLPPFAPIFRGVVGIRIHSGLKIRWASTPVPVRVRPPRPRGCVWKSRPSGFKNRCASGAWACKSPQPHQFIIGKWWNKHTRESQKLEGASLCRCKSCLADHFTIALSSNEHRRPVSQAGNVGASPIRATNAPRSSK